MKAISHNPAVRLGAVAAALFVVASGVATGTIPDSHGVVHACYGNNEALRVYDPTAGGTCRNTAVDLVSPAGAWSPFGNAGTTPGTNFLGTTDNVALELEVNGSRALRLEPATVGDAPFITV